MKKVLLVLFVIILNFSTYAQDGFTFRKPENRMDSLSLNIQYTKLCLGKFYDQHREGTYFNIFGAAIASCGVFINFNVNATQSGLTKINYGLIGIGSALCIFGTIDMIDSYKWMNRASFRPLLTPNGAGVIVNF